MSGSGTGSWHMVHQSDQEADTDSGVEGTRDLENRYGQGYRPVSRAWASIRKVLLYPSSLL
jgi:hypothetical protein